MSTKAQQTVNGRKQLVAAFALLLIATAVQASPSVSQVVAVSQAIQDESGIPLAGTSPSAALFGQPVVEGDLVQVLQATDGRIYPPDAQGNPDPRNLVLKTTRIGLGVAPHLSTPAKFGATLSPRPGGNSKLFVRVFNAPTMHEASFYGDSQLFTVRSWKNEVFAANVAATDKPLDTTDSDEDGLANSWERTLGTDPDVADSDGDGFSDGAEQLAGTDSLDGESMLVMAGLDLASPGVLRVRWDSSAGVTYRVEHVAGELTGTPAVEVLEVVEGVDGTSEVLIRNLPASRTGSFRVCAVSP